MDKLLTDKELAQYLGVSMQTIYKWAMDKKLPPHVMIGTTRRYPESYLQKYIDENIKES